MDARGNVTMDVGYNKAFGAVMLALATLCLVLGVMVNAGMTIAIGAMNVVIGILYLVRPYFVVGQGTIELRNLLGMTMRTYHFGDLAALEVTPDGKTIHQIEPGGARTRLKLSRWLADGGDWRRFTGLLQARVFE